MTYVRIFLLRFPLCLRTTGNLTLDWRKRIEHTQKHISRPLPYRPRLLPTCRRHRRLRPDHRLPPPPHHHHPLRPRPRRPLLPPPLPPPRRPRRPRPSLPPRSGE